MSAVIKKDKYGYYTYCPQLKGCQMQGDSSEEVLKNIKETVELYLETMSKEETESLLSKKIFSASLEVRVV